MAGSRRPNLCAVSAPPRPSATRHAVRLASAPNSSACVPDPAHPAQPASRTRCLTLRVLQQQVRRLDQRVPLRREARALGGRVTKLGGVREHEVAHHAVVRRRVVARVRAVPAAPARAELEHPQRLAVARGPRSWRRTRRARRRRNATAAATSARLEAHRATWPRHGGGAADASAALARTMPSAARTPSRCPRLLDVGVEFPAARHCGARRRRTCACLRRRPR